MLSAFPRPRLPCLLWCPPSPLFWVVPPPSRGLVSVCLLSLFVSLFLLDAVSAFQRPCFPSCFVFLPSCRPSCFPLLDAVSAFPLPCLPCLSSCLPSCPFFCLPSLFPVYAIKLSVPFHVSENALQQHYLYSTNAWGLSLRWCNFLFFPMLSGCFVTIVDRPGAWQVHCWIVQRQGCAQWTAGKTLWKVPTNVIKANVVDFHKTTSHGGYTENWLIDYWCLYIIIYTHRPMFIINVYIDAQFFIVILHWKNSEH